MMEVTHPAAVTKNIDNVTGTTWKQHRKNVKNGQNAYIYNKQKKLLLVALENRFITPEQEEELELNQESFFGNVEVYLRHIK